MAQYEDKISDLTTQLNTEKQAHENTKKMYEDLLAENDELKQKADEAIINSEKIQHLTEENEDLKNRNEQLQAEVQLRCDQVKESLKQGSQA